MRLRLRGAVSTLVRIDLIEGKPAKLRRAVGNTVYRLLVDVLKAPIVGFCGCRRAFQPGTGGAARQVRPG